MAVKVGGASYRRQKPKDSASIFGSAFPTTPSPSTPLPTMDSTSQRPKKRDGPLLALDALIQVLTLANGISSVPPAQVALGSAVALLTMIRVRFPSLCDGGFLTLAI